MPAQNSISDNNPYCVNHAGVYFSTPDLTKARFRDSFIVYSKTTGKTECLSKLEIDILNNCRNPKTLDDHEKYCCRELHLQQDLIRELIKKLADRCYLLSTQYLHELSRQNYIYEAPNKINYLGLITSNRPSHLQRCLLSYLINNKKFGRGGEYIVADDTRDATIRAEIRNKLQSVEKEYAVKISYLGLEEKYELKSKLIGTGELPEDVVNFALFNNDSFDITIGANRNALILYTAGNLMLSTDDDVFCHVASAPNAINKTVIGNIDEYNEYWFFCDRKSALESIEFVDKDVFALHEEMLGKRVVSYISSLNNIDSFELGTIDPIIFNNIKSAQARIKFTYAGTVGDSALKTPVRYLYVGGSSRVRLLKNEAIYHSSYGSREIMRVVTRPVITSHSWCMTGAMAFDNTDMIPPFFPVEKNEDSIYGEVLRSVFKNSCYGHIPYVFIHDPPEKRIYEDKYIYESAVHLHSSHLLIACIRSFNKLTMEFSTESTMQLLGRYLTNIGLLPLSEFKDFLRQRLLFTLSYQAESVSKIMISYNKAPTYWLKDAERHIEALQNQILKAENIYPHNLSGRGDSEDVINLTRTLIFKYGQLLIWWPHIYNCAKLLSK